MRNTEFISKDTKLFVSLAETPGNTGTIWFNKMFTKKNIDAIYKAFQVERGEFKRVFEGIRGLKISGGAISMPFKRQAFELVDEVRGIASDIGAINTFFSEASGKIVGYNTDYSAALRALPERSKKIYLLGAGGVAASVALAVQNRKCGSLTIITRKNRAELSMPAEVSFEWCSWREMNDLEPPDMVINCTPLGMKPDLELLLPAFWWPQMKLAIDLTFRPEGNLFFNQAKANMVSMIDGKMFAGWQALEQFKIYTGITIDEAESGY